jgi:hypothetical protein
VNSKPVLGGNGSLSRAQSDCIQNLQFWPPGRETPDVDICAPIGTNSHAINAMRLSARISTLKHRKLLGSIVVISDSADSCRQPNLE